MVWGIAALERLLASMGPKRKNNILGMPKSILKA